MKGSDGILVLSVFAVLFANLAGSTALWTVMASDVAGPVQFREIYYLSGDGSERRSPKVGEEFRVAASIRNIGSTAFYYLPTLCDSSLSATFDPIFVRVETDRPRCLALSRPTPLNPGEEVTVSGPESGTAYVAIRAGSTEATITFSYQLDPNAEQLGASTKVPLTVQDGFLGIAIPGFPPESLLIGFTLAFVFIAQRRRMGLGPIDLYEELGRSPYDALMSRLALLLGIVILGVAFAAAPMPLTTTFEDPPRSVTIYPNLLFAVPLILLGILFLLYGVTSKRKNAT